MKKAIGIDFGGTRIKLGIVDEDGVLQKKEVIDTEDASTPDTWLDAVERGLLLLDGDMDGWAGRYEGLGVGVPGFVEFERGLIYDLPNVPGWNGVHLAALLEKRFGLPAFIDNDVNVMALGECTYGAGRLFQDAVFLTLGTGVGGGLLLNGRLYRGASSMAGEIGHMTVNLDGPRTPYGCGELERYVGNRRIVEFCLQQLEAGRESSIPGLVGGALDRVDPKIIQEAAAQGDALGLEVYDRMARYLAAALASIAYVLQPQVFVIGGGVAKAGAVLFDPLRRHLAERLHPVFFERLDIRIAELGNNAGIIGGGTLALKHGKA